MGCVFSDLFLCINTHICIVCSLHRKLRCVFFLNRWVHTVYDLLFHLTTALLGSLSTTARHLSCFCDCSVLRSEDRLHLLTQPLPRTNGWCPVWSRRRSIYSDLCARVQIFLYGQFLEVPLLPEQLRTCDILTACAHQPSLEGDKCVLPPAAGDMNACPSLDLTFLDG